MKKLLSLVFVAAIVCLAFAGCSKKERLNYVKGLDGYVTLCDLDNIVISTNSEEYIKARADYDENSLSRVKRTVTSGKVKDGDTVNIDYLGKVNGVAFKGGEAKGYELEIGSGTFIEGFEDQIIGKEIGSTFDISVTFPEGYSDTVDAATESITIKLAGKPAVFTVTVNSASSTYDMISEEFAIDAGYKDIYAYEETARKASIKNVLYQYLCDNSTVNSIPDDSEGNSYGYYKNLYTNQVSNYGMTFESFLSANNTDEATFKKTLLSGEAVMYSAFDKLKLSVDTTEIDDRITSIANQYSVKNEDVEEYYTKNFIESEIVAEKVLDNLMNSKVTVKTTD